MDKHDFDQDDLAPMRGVIYGCVMGLLSWLPILWIFFG
jgi:hypothetical protein